MGYGLKMRLGTRCKFEDILCDNYGNEMFIIDKILE